MTSERAEDREAFYATLPAEDRDRTRTITEAIYVRQNVVLSGTSGRPPSRGR